ncbi:TPA: hypothetical protein ACRR3R_004647 [Klebsiella quasipneumoniae]
MTTDITELAQRMKTAAEKLDADQWQTRKGFSGIEVIVKGSLEKGHGCVSFQPVAADMADTKTARAIALFSPANVLALVEALEKAQQIDEELCKLLPLGAEYMDPPDGGDVTPLEGVRRMVADYRQRIADLESRTVTFKLPFTPEPSAFAPWVAKAFYQFHKDTVKSCVAVFSDACAAAGIKVETE